MFCLKACKRHGAYFACSKTHTAQYHFLSPWALLYWAWASPVFQMKQNQVSTIWSDKQFVYEMLNTWVRQACVFARDKNDHFTTSSSVCLFSRTVLPGVGLLLLPDWRLQHQLADAPLCPHFATYWFVPFSTYLDVWKSSHFCVIWEGMTSAVQD